MTGWLLNILRLYLLDISLIQRDIYYRFFSSFYDYILERFATRNGKLTVELIFVECGNVWGSHSQAIGARS